MTLRPEPHVHGSWDDFAREMHRLRRENERLQRRVDLLETVYNTCCVCLKPFGDIAENAPPACDDCDPLDRHVNQWDARVAALSESVEKP